MGVVREGGGRWGLLSRLCVAVSLIGGVMVGVGAGPVASADSYTTFDPPGSLNTSATGINDSGVITGYYFDGGQVRGFVRASDGTITTFDPPGSLNTIATGINDSGVITGDYFVGRQSRGFVRASDGTITTFDPPGSTDTFPKAINESGVITGYFLDGSFQRRGFVRASDGTITTFDPPGSLFTQATGINDSGVITGYYNGGGRVRGFVRASDGTITTFEPPGSLDTSATGINDSGVITGYFLDGGQFRGFVRASDGTITTFEPPGSLVTFPRAITESGVITGDYNDGGRVRGFVRASDGTITTFDPPGSTSTIPRAINDSGVITGDYSDGTGSRGFVRVVVELCRPGTFSDTGAEPCIPAPLGTFTNVTGATGVTLCAVGTYQDAVGQTSCLAAPVGFFVDRVGAAVATSCPAGFTTTGEGSTSLDDCIAVDREVTRIGGATRVDTAIDVSQSAFGPGAAEAVVLARSDLYPDALVGAPLAALTNAPLLLTSSDVLPGVVLDEINRVLPVGATVYVLGGTASVEPAVEAALVNAGYIVERLGGVDRLETATKVADAIAVLVGADTDTVLLASGLGFADALAASAAAAEHAHPVLLTAGDAPSAATTAWIGANTPGELFCVGGPACVAADNDPVTDTAIEIIGATRYSTATKVAVRFFDPGTPIGVASGVEFPDALAAAAETPNRGGPLLLTEPASLPVEVDTFIDTWNPTTIVIYGGPAAVSPEVAQQLAN